VEEAMAGGSKQFDLDEMSQHMDQTVLLIGQTFNLLITDA